MEEEIRLCHYLSDPSDQIFLQLRLLFARVLLSIKSGEETYPSMSGASLSKFLTAAILASGVDGGPSVDIGKPMAIHKTTTRMKMDNKHQCCRRKWTPKAKRRTKE